MISEKPTLATAKPERQGLINGNVLAEIINDCSIDRVMAIDLHWNIISWNKTAELMSGISKQKLLGKNLLEIFPQLLADKELLTAINNAMEGKKSFLPSNPLLFNRQHYENHFIPLKDEENKVLGVMNIMHDVAHRIKAEKQLQKLNDSLAKKYAQLQNASGELASFTYITSHDIKEPIKHIYTSLELLVKTEGASLSNSSRANLRRIQGSLNKMNLLLDDILSVSRISAHNQGSTTVDLNAALRVSTALLSEKIIQRNAVIQAEKLPLIKGYGEMLNYLFMNIIDNSLKFQSESSTPRIVIQSDEIVVRSNKLHDAIEDRKYTRVSFTDNGIGIDPENFERIFSMFEKVHENKKYAGSGIGLTICKKIIEAHDGFMEVKSALGQGASFHCYFPVENEESEIFFHN